MPGSDLRSLTRDLDRASRGAIRNELKRAMRAHARPVVNDVRAAIRRIPSESTGGTLRADMAKTVKLKVMAGKTIGVSIYIDPSKLGAKRPMPFAHERGGTFSHPVYGRGRVTQRAYPFMAPTVSPKEGEIARTLEAATAAILKRELGS